MTSAQFLINQREAGASGLDDVKMVHLTDSIEGLFDAAPDAVPAKAAEKPLVAVPVQKPQVAATPVAKPAVQPTNVEAQAAPTKAKVVVTKQQAKPPAAKVVKVAATKQQVKSAPMKVVNVAAAKKFVNVAAAKLQVQEAPAKIVKVVKVASSAKVVKVATTKQQIKPALVKVAQAAGTKQQAKPATAKVPEFAATNQHVESPKVVKAAAVKPEAKELKPKVAEVIAEVVAQKSNPKAATTKASVPVAKLAKKAVDDKPYQDAKVAKVVKPKLQKPVAHAAKIVVAAAKPPQPKAVKAVATLPKPKDVKPAAKVVKPFAKVLNAAAKPPQPNVVKAAAKPQQPKAVKAPAKVVKPVAKVVKAAAKPLQTQASKPAAKVVRATAKSAQPKAVKPVAKVAKLVNKQQKDAVKMLNKPKAPKMEKVLAASQVVAKPLKAKKVAKKVERRSSMSKLAEKYLKPEAKTPVVTAMKPAVADLKPTLAPIAKVQVAATIAATVAAKPSLAKQLKASSRAMSSHNKSVTTSTANATGNHTVAPAENKTKVIEEAVPSLPMASFALDIASVANTTKVEAPVFPGNASQKAAWDKKEHTLEKEVAILKSRLETVNASQAKPVPPAATGTFNAHLGSTGVAKTVDAKAVKFVASKRTAPMEPIRKEKIPKATWPSMKSLAAPVVIPAIHAAAAPPQKQAIEAQEGKVKKVQMGTTFTGTPARKVQSVMALDSVVDHDAVMTEWQPPRDATDDDSTPAAAAPAVPAPSNSWLKAAVKWVASFYSRVFPKNAMESAKLAPIPGASLLDTTKRGVKQDMLRTAQATKEESEHVISLTSVWGQLEEEDRVQEERVKSEDESERQQARAVAEAHTETAAELKGRHGADMSGFWSQLEHQDAELEKSVSSENLGEYRRLMDVQEHMVGKAASQMKDNHLHTERTPALHGNDNAFLSKTIHDTWEVLAEKDQAIERKIHDSPDLQMIQLKRHYRSTRK
jgi:hypothetical protein